MAAVITFAKRLAALAVLAGMSVQAFAQSVSCPGGGSPLIAADITTLLSGKTVCATSGGDRWQEYHQAGGALIDYKKGPSDPVDPTKTVGGWSANGSAITYNYTDGGISSYSFAVCAASATSLSGTFVPLQSGVNIPFTLIAGQSACP